MKKKPKVKTSPALKALNDSPALKALKTIGDKRIVIFVKLLALAKECGIDVFKDCRRKRAG